MDPKAVMAILRDLVEELPDVSEIEPDALPSDVANAIETWANGINLPTDDPDTSAEYYKISSSDDTICYLADFSGDDPDPFRATVLVRGADVLGDCVDVAS